MLQDDVPKAIPLWINGHAFLTVTSAFHEVRSSAGGEVLRRVPLCGAGEVQMAIAAAQVALAFWAGLPETARIALLVELGEALASYDEHFAGLISEESGRESSLSVTEVGESVTLLRNPTASKNSGVVAIIGNSVRPLLDSLKWAVPALASGSTVVIRPCPEAASALFALAELSGRCGIPDGVFNIVHGDEAIVDVLRARSDVCLYFS